MPPSTRSRGRWVAPAGTLAGTTRYRDGERTPVARSAHTAETTEWKRRRRDDEFGPDLRAEFLDALRRAGAVKAAGSEVGITPMRVYGRMKWDEAFSKDVEEILAKRCLGGDLCGTEWGYRRRGGRCADCRAAKAATRGQRGSSRTAGG